MKLSDAQIKALRYIARNTQPRNVHGSVSDALRRRGLIVFRGSPVTGGYYLTPAGQQVMAEIGHGHGGPGRGGGRPAIEPGVATVLATGRVTPAQREKFLKLGGSAWLRDQIDAAPDPD